MAARYNPPPNWPAPPPGWNPPPGWQPDPSWGPAPEGWQLWVDGPASATPRPWFKKKRFIIPGALVLLVIVMGAINGGDGDSGTRAAETVASPGTDKDDEETSEESTEKREAAAAQAEADAAAKAEEERVAEEQRLAEEAAAAEAAAAEAARIGTLSQQNAYGQARQYLQTMPFSRAGLLDQLTSEYGGQFPPQDAEFGVARLEAEGGVDWFAEAVEAAEAYQGVMPMSRQALIDQLTSEYGSQFTLEQATHAVNTLGL